MESSMTDVPLQQGEGSQGFVFQVEHTLKSHSQALALQDLKRLLEPEHRWP